MVTADEVLRSSAVVGATDPTTAVDLLPGLHEPQLRAVTTFHHVAELPPDPDAIVLIDAAGIDGAIESGRRAARSVLADLGVSFRSALEAEVSV